MYMWLNYNHTFPFHYKNASTPSYIRMDKKKLYREKQTNHFYTDIGNCLIYLYQYFGRISFSASNNSFMQASASEILLHIGSVSIALRNIVLSPITAA